MDFQTELTKVKDLVSQAHDILIVTHEHPAFDSIGSSLALYLGLLSLGKKVTIACPDAITVELSSFVGINKVTHDIGQKNFIISLDYVEGSIEKVSYNIEGNTFNLVIEPRVGFPSFSQEKVHYSEGGAANDLIFTINTIHLGGLKKLYEDNKELFASKPVVNIDRHPNNVHFGQVNLVDGQASSTAELVGQLLPTLGVSMTQDIATNLLNALYGGTNNFSNFNVTAGAFDLAAACMKAGGKRFRRPTASEELPKPESGSSQPMAETPVKPMTRLTEAPVSHPPAGGSVQAPADWLKPKIFKSSNLL